MGKLQDLKVKTTVEFEDINICHLLTVKKKLFYLVIEKIFWNLRLKAKNLQTFWDHQNNLFKQWKVGTIFKKVLTWSWRFLRSNELEQLEFKLEKVIVI